MSETWRPGVERAKTAARGGYGIAPGTMKATALVYHCMQGHLSTMRLWASEPAPVHHQSSYHFGISLTGDIVEFVEIGPPAWHAGRLDQTKPTWSGWVEGKSVNSHTLSIAAEGFSQRNAWTDAQLESALTLQRWINQETGMVSSEDTIITHAMIAPTSRANDPGPNFPRDLLIKQTSADEPEPPPKLTRPEMMAAFRDLLVPNNSGRRKASWLKARSVEGGEEHTMLIKRRSRK